MTKQEALAILERNADPYLADPAELAKIRVPLHGLPYTSMPLLPVVGAGAALKNFRLALAAFRADPDSYLGALRGDDVHAQREAFKGYITDAREALLT